MNLNAVADSVNPFRRERYNSLCNPISKPYLRDHVKGDNIEWDNTLKIQRIYSNSSAK